MKLGYARVSIIFRWYDFWIGAYYDRRKRFLYVLPLPCLGFVLRFRHRVRCHKCGSPAFITCITKDFIYDEHGRPRDPLCGKHGVPGPCPDGHDMLHVLIAPNDRHYYEEIAL